jgi:hypothetical protein
MTKAQEIDYAYHVDRLLLLIARRVKLALDVEGMLHRAGEAVCTQGKPSSNL